MNEGSKKLFRQMITKFILGFVMIGFLLFLSAGTVHYVNGWLFILALAIPMMIFGLYLFAKHPKTLGKRLNSKEKEKTQKKVVGLSGLLFVLAFILSGLDWRFNWSKMPLWLSFIALGFMLLGYGLFMAVILQNQYASRVVEVQKEQKVITNGLYKWVRHPMYFASVLLFLSIPLVLGSYVGFVLMLPYPFTLVKRVENEETLLQRELPGYEEYMEKTKYKMIPFVW